MTIKFKEMPQEKCWQLYDSSKGYYLQGFYTSKTITIPKKYNKILDKLRTNKDKYRNMSIDCEVAISDILKKVLKRNKK